MCIRRSFLAFAVVVSVLASACGNEATVDDVTVSVVVTEPITTTSTTTGTTITTTTITTTTITTTTTPSKPTVFAFPTADAVSDWSVVNDTVMGGVSTGRLAWQDGAMVFTGDLSLDNNGGFASVRGPFIEPSIAAGWSDTIGPSVKLRGDGRVWTLEVRMDGDNGGWISTLTTRADAVTVIEPPWESFEPVTRFLDPRQPTTALDPARIVSVAFYLVDGIEAPFRLELLAIS